MHGSLLSGVYSQRSLLIFIARHLPSESIAKGTSVETGVTSYCISDRLIHLTCLDRRSHELGKDHMLRVTFSCQAVMQNSSLTIRIISHRKTRLLLRPFQCQDSAAIVIDGLPACQLEVDSLRLHAVPERIRVGSALNKKIVDSRLILFICFGAIAHVVWVEFHDFALVERSKGLFEDCVPFVGDKVSTASERCFHIFPSLGF